MANVTFTANFDYKPNRNTVIAYKSGWTGAVRRECANQAIAAGKAYELKAPRRRGRFNYAEEAKFDHDGDGRPGGSVPSADAT